jgi:hypothetical protein
VRELGFLEMAAAKCKLKALAKAWATCDPPYMVLVDVADAAGVADADAVGVDVVGAAA